MRGPVGLIGVGEIGFHFATRLLESSYEIFVFDKDASKVQAVIDRGATSADSPARVAQRSDIVLLSLTDSGAVESVMTSPNGVIEALHPGHMVVDTGTSRPAADLRWAEACARRAAGYLDAPVTWRGDRLLMAVGGAEDHFTQAREILECISSRLEHVGPVGSGHTLKLVNQLILLGQMAIQAEAVAFASQLGVDPRIIPEVLELIVPSSMFGEDFQGPPHIGLGCKDLGYILEAAQEVGANVPLTSLVHEVFKATSRRGIEQVQPAIVTYWRRLNEARV